ncbi:MAG: GNAT family N-acetyltransferase [Methyloceanibacter sp.]|uniref:GNAT family N-acetyltransferase n=1 Tax=Methyloceanibacter sp. TaxID=1965321 RepID=UPI003D6CDDDD
MLRSETFGDVAPAPAAVRAAATPMDYDVDIVRDAFAARARLDAVCGEGDATPFQAPGWLSAWHATVGVAQQVEPLFVFVSERGTGRAVVTLPLILRRTDALEVISFADLGVTDYNAPVLGPAAPMSPAGAGAMWKAVMTSLPAADLIQLEKMPASVRGRPNPLALLPGVHPSHSPGFSISTPGDWDAYLCALSKKFRKELGRSLRLFEKENDASFCRIETVDEALDVLHVMNEQQRSRLDQMGSRYVLDETAYQAFYARLMAEGIKDGSVILTALIAGGEVIAALLGVTDGSSFTMVRLSHAGGDWMKVGPGRLIIERTMHMLHARGCRHFDFSIGDYPYKSGFGVEPSPLFDLVGAPSWRGRIRAVQNLAKATVKRGLGRLGISLVPQAVKDRYRRYHGAK